MAEWEGYELSKQLDQKYKELRSIEQQWLEKEKEIRKLKKRCSHRFGEFSAVDKETGVCRICRQQIE
jgi:ribosomal protein S14